MSWDIEMCGPPMRYYFIMSPHHGGTIMSPEHIDRFRREVEFMQHKWAELLEEDPFYNPNLNIAVADFTMAFPPRRRAPWQVGRE